MNLYEIKREILALIDEETGEILNWEAFDQLQMARDTKLENVACFIKNLAAEAAAIRQEEVILAKRRKVAENKVDGLMRYLQEALNGENFKTAKCAVSFRKTTKVDVKDPAAAIEWAEMNGHKECVTYKAPEINKTELAKLLKGEVTIPGAELLVGQSMSVK